MEEPNQHQFPVVCWALQAALYSGIKQFLFI